MWGISQASKAEDCRIVLSSLFQDFDDVFASHTVKAEVHRLFDGRLSQNADNQIRYGGFLAKYRVYCNLSEGIAGNRFHLLTICSHIVPSSVYTFPEWG